MSRPGRYAAQCRAPDGTGRCDREDRVRVSLIGRHASLAALAPSAMSLLSKGVYRIKLHARLLDIANLSRSGPRGAQRRRFEGPYAETRR